jgi:hypothetical protein
MNSFDKNIVQELRLNRAEQRKTNALLEAQLVVLKDIAEKLTPTEEAVDLGLEVGPITEQP